MKPSFWDYQDEPVAPIRESEIPRPIKEYFLQYVDLKNQPVRQEDGVRLIGAICSHCYNHMGYGRVHRARATLHDYTTRDTFQILCFKCQEAGLDFKEGEYVKNQMELKYKILNFFPMPLKMREWFLQKMDRNFIPSSKRKIIKRKEED